MKECINMTPYDEEGAQTKRPYHACRYDDDGGFHFFSSIKPLCAKILREMIIIATRLR